MIPVSGSARMFLFRGPADMRKGFDGLALWHKRLERGKFLMPADKEGASAELTSAELSMLLEGITPLRVNRRYRLGAAAAASG